VIPRTIVSGADALAEAEQGKAEALAALGEAPSFERYEALRRSQEHLEELQAAPVRIEVEHVRTGRTVAQEWHARDVLGRRELLADALVSAVVMPGIPSRNRVDLDRLDITWRDELASEEDYDAP
jgi:hypothetical protein